jgi:predicted RNase H-like HicB family nuclease
MHYPVVIHKDKHSDYGVSVPDLPGCISAGKTVDDALAMIREAIELHLEGLIEDGGVVPAASPIEKLRADPDFACGTWAIVNVDESSLRIGYARIGITMPERVLDAIDRYAKSSGETRSGLLARAAIQYIGRDVDSLPTAQRGGANLRNLRATKRKDAKPAARAPKVRKAPKSPR